MTGFLDMKPVDAALDCEAAESTCYYGSTKHLATEVSDEKKAAVFDTSDAEDAQSDIAETSSVLNASFTVNQNPRDLEAKMEYLELHLSIHERKVEVLEEVYAKRHLELLEHLHNLELRLSNCEREVEELAKVCAIVHVCPFTKAKLEK